jgi:hypothetical protein
VYGLVDADADQVELSRGMRIEMACEEFEVEFELGHWYVFKKGKDADLCRVCGRLEGCTLEEKSHQQPVPQLEE